MLTIHVLITWVIASIYYLDKDQFPHKIHYGLVPPKALGKRQTSNVYSKTMRTHSIRLEFTCIHPFGETKFQRGRCSQLGDALEYAAFILETHFVLRETVRIETHLKPFCNDQDNNPSNAGRECVFEDRTLGRAAPTAMYTFNQTAAQRFGLDAEYGYPTALARQFVPNDSNLPNTDISATFNSGYNWKLPSNKSPIWGKSISVNGGFLNQTNQVSFDLVQVALHEYMHGLGFISSWSEHNGMFFPSYLTFDDLGRVTGMMPAWIYTKFFSDRQNGVWFDSYRRIIIQSISETLRKLGEGSNFEQEYKTSVGHQIGLAVFKMFTVPQSVLIWFPSKDDKMTFGVINTPRSFSYGSSVSHLDGNMYSGIGSFLMRPSATGGVEWNKMIPNTRDSLGSAVLGIFRGMGYAVIAEI
jgi:hypothetical protein